MGTLLSISTLESQEDFSFLEIMAVSLRPWKSFYV